MTEDLFFPATWQQKRRLPSLRVDNTLLFWSKHWQNGTIS